MSDQPQGTVADAGKRAPGGINQICEAEEQLARLIRERPICAVLVAIGIGYLLGKIT